MSLSPGWRSWISALAVFGLIGLTIPARGGRAAEVENLPLVAGVAGGALGAALVLSIFETRLAPAQCRVCASDGLDESVRDAVRWDRPKFAKGISDGLVVAIPASAIAGAFALGSRTAHRQGFEDALLVVESVSVAGLGAQIVKILVARERPFALHGTGTYANDTDAHLSFFSGHTTLTMAAATSLASVARRRGHAAWPYLLAGGAALSLTTGYLRLGADKHWFTDVAMGAVWGATVGSVMPMLHLGPAGTGNNAKGVTVMATPFAVLGTF